MNTKVCHLCSKQTGMEVRHHISEFGRSAVTDDGFSDNCQSSRAAYVRNREALKAAELKLARMDIPPRPDKVFNGNPGLPLKRVSTNRKDWNW
jgi:hypothetical protein